MNQQRVLSLINIVFDNFSPLKQVFFYRNVFIFIFLITQKQGLDDFLYRLAEGIFHNPVKLETI